MLGASILRGLSSLSATVLPVRRFVADLAFPPCCAVCGAGGGDHGALCAGCWGGIRFIERPYCEVMGTPFSYDPGPDILSAEAIANPPVFDRLRSAALYEGCVRELVGNLKYRDRIDLSLMMAAWMQRAGGDALARADAVLPVPLHRQRLMSRKFNQSAELARHIAARSGKPFLHASLIRRKKTAQQVGLGLKAREDNVRGAFAMAPGHELDVAGLRVVLVDDVYTTGATVASVTRVLKKAGAIDVTVLTFARALDGPI
jgi:ComF family protein